MTLLSVIIPVHRVEEHLPLCLDSVLTQAPTDVEVIAVDDASDDDCAKILAEYAGRDPRLTVVTHDRNLGLSAARNSGLAAASGEYVWFVDSDDWLPDGTLPAVTEKLRQDRPDLLVTGYARMYPTGRVRLELPARTVQEQPPSETFTLQQYPHLLSVLHIACNKVVRRRFLTDLGLTFQPGWYEDVSFSLPLMVAAERISLLNRHCYAYRQRANGAITHTVSDRHFEVFAQWDRVFAFLAGRPEVPAELRGLVFQRMTWHLLHVLGHAHRVPPARRREFFAAMTARYRKHRPATGHPNPSGIDGLKHRLVARGAYGLFETLRRGYRTASVLRPRRGSGAGSGWPARIDPDLPRGVDPRVQPRRQPSPQGSRLLS